MSGRQAGPGKGEGHREDRQLELDHLQQDHEIGYRTGHVADIIGIPHLDRMSDHLGLDFAEDIFKKIGMPRDLHHRENLRELRKGYFAVYASLRLEKVVD